MPSSSASEYIIEHFIFHDLARRPRRDDVIGTYLAVQSAISFGIPEVDVGSYLSRVLPDLRKLNPDPYCSPLGKEGLAHFHWLFEVELVTAGATNYHVYRFTRRRDKAQVLAELKTTLQPRSEATTAAYNAYLGKLTKRRERLLATQRWATSGELLDRA